LQEGGGQEGWKASWTSSMTTHPRRTSAADRSGPPFLHKDLIVPLDTMLVKQAARATCPFWVTATVGRRRQQQLLLAYKAQRLIPGGPGNAHVIKLKTRNLIFFSLQKKSS